MNISEFLSLCACAQNPWHFFTEYVYTQDPARGVCRYPDYDYLCEFLWVMHHERMLLVPKSRQMMVTWSVVAYTLWRAFFQRPGMYLFISRNERCAAELLERARFILEHLPEYMRPKLLRNSQEEIEFAGIGSRILSLPASPNGPRMYSPAGVFWDEMAFTPFDEQIWTALKPALDSGGKFVGVSSSGGAMNLFARMASANPNPLSPKSEIWGNQKGVDQGSMNLFARMVQSRCRGGLSPRNPPADSTEPNGRVAEDLNPPLQNTFHIQRIHYSMHPERKNDAWKRRAMSGLSLTKWEQEQEISFDAVEDLVYSEFDPVIHILQSEPLIDPRLKLYRAIDFGYRHPYVLWLMINHEGHIMPFDEWVGKDRTTEEMLDAINAKDLSHGITEIDIEWTACDPAGAAMQDAGISPVDYLRNRGVKIRYRPSRVSAGIECVKQALYDARRRTKVFISPRCPQLISDFRRYKWDARKEEPLKDGLSDHSMDALRYFFVNLETPDEQPYAPRVASMAR